MGFVFFTAIALAICIVGLVIAEKQNRSIEGWACGVVICGIALLCLLIVVAVHPISVRAQFAQFHAVQQTLEDARQNADISQFELAAMQHKTAERNQWLANAKFWSEHWLTSWFWPTKDVLALQPIK